eukprot:gnl/Trimastix_PCT/3408.p1 GENE.gnl/Trimastix_PCT/3408~~gnl/Trimastix_PCT/3408.p1  ORF type:complete len:325 (-),score=29.90 gnl/Trimastix_PCT/3408:67-993(-)
MPDTFRVASIQCSSVLGATQANTEKLTRLIEQAAQNGAKIIVTPETCVTGYLSQNLRTNWHVPGRPLESEYTNSLHPQDYAETVPGPSTNHFCALAQRLGVYVTIPLLEKESDQERSDRVSREHAFNSDLTYFDFMGVKRNSETEQATQYFNSVCVAGPDGTLVAHYRKINPWPWPEQSWATAGRNVVCFDTPYGRCGLSICFDIHRNLDNFQEAGETPRRMWALLYPIAWVDRDTRKWFRSTLPARLAQRQSDYYLIGANWSVDEDVHEWNGMGYTTIYGPQGEILASTEERVGEVIVYAEVETSKY